jgi:xanthine dehydrogenase accessory factor
VVRCDPPTSARPGDKAIVTSDGRLRGWVGGSCAEPVVRREALRALSQGVPCLVRIRPEGSIAEEEPSPGGRSELVAASTCPSGGSLDVFIEPHLPKPQLLVFGDSPAARTLVQLASLTGFRTCAVHPGARLEDHARADLVLPSLELASAFPDEDTWAVVATMGHYDEDALEACLALPGLEVALVASRRRTEAVREGLRRRGLDDEALGRVRAPAGTVQGATQEEIALFALAELVSLRRERQQTGAAVRRSSLDTALSRFVTDPVCGMVVESSAGAVNVIHEGKRIYFCSAGCLDRFQLRPAAFLERADQIEG